MEDQESPPGAVEPLTLDSLEEVAGPSEEAGEIPEALELQEVEAAAGPSIESGNIPEPIPFRDTAEPPEPLTLDGLEEVAGPSEEAGAIPEPLALHEVEAQAAPVPASAETHVRRSRPARTFQKAPAKVIQLANPNCVKCDKPFDTRIEALHIHFFPMECKRHYRHKDCEVKRCQPCLFGRCAVCEQPFVGQPDRRVYSCECHVHYQCAPNGIWPFSSAPDYCVRCKTKITVAHDIGTSVHSGLLTSITSRVNPDVTTAGLAGNKWRVEEIVKNGVTALDLYHSDLSLHDLCKLGFTLSTFRDLGVTGQDFITRFFHIATIVSELRPGRVSGLEERGPVTGVMLLRIFQLRVPDLLRANVGLLNGPPSAYGGQATGCRPLVLEDLSSLLFTVEDLVDYGLTFDLVAHFGKPPAVWELLQDAKGIEDYLKDLDYSPRFRGRRGEALLEIQWSEEEVKMADLWVEAIPTEEVPFEPPPMTEYPPEQGLAPPLPMHPPQPLPEPVLHFTSVPSHVVSRYVSSPGLDFESPAVASPEPPKKGISRYI